MSSDLTPARLEELLAAGKRFADDPNLYRPRLFDIVTRKDGADRRYEGEWIRDVMRDVPALAARVIELEAELGRYYEALRAIEVMPEQGGCDDGVDAVEMWTMMRKVARAALETPNAK